MTAHQCCSENKQVACDDSRNSLLAKGHIVRGIARHLAQHELESVQIVIKLVTRQLFWTCTAACDWLRVVKPKPTASLDLKAYCGVQNGQSVHSYTDRSAPRLDGPVDLYTGPQAKRANLEICRRPDGTLWLLGEGACGKVYKVRHRQTTDTDRQQTQTDNRQTSDVPVLKVYTRVTFQACCKPASGRELYSAQFCMFKLEHGLCHSMHSLTLCP